MRKEFWDWPPEPPRRGRRFEKVEILPPRQPRHDVRVTLHHRREAPPIGVVILMCAIAVLIFAWRPLLLFVMFAPQLFGVALLVGFILTAVAIRDRRRGRPF